MKRSSICTTLLAILVFATQSFGQTDTITILHINDTHSCLAPIGPRDASLRGSLGGIARIASLVGMLRMSNPNTIFLHSGDVFMGDLFFNVYFGSAEFQLLLSLGLDALAVGNHEFDLTPSTLLTALDSSFTNSGFPLLSANLILDDPSVRPLKKYIQPYTIKHVGNVKIGIFGLTTPATNILSMPQPAIIDSNFLNEAAWIVDTLKSKGCQVIVCLSHLGLMYDELLAQSVDGIHVIVGGHDHYALQNPVVIRDPKGDPTYIVQANAFYLNLGQLNLSVTGNSVHILSYKLYDIDNTIPEEPFVRNVVDGLVAGIETTYGPVFTKRIGYAAGDFEEVTDSLTADGCKDTPVGKLVTDAFRAETGTEIALEAGGSTAQKLYKGPIVADDLFRVVGYGFNQQNGLGYSLATFKMSGASLLAGLEFGLSSIEENDEYLLQTSGIKYTYYAGRPQGHRLTNATCNGKAIDPDRLYTVTANQFIPLFLDHIGIPYCDLHVCGGDTTEFQVLAAYVANLDTITPVRNTGIIISPVKGVQNSTPLQFKLNQNYPNPFNPSTSISFSLHSTAIVSLKIYDLLGKEVATVVSGEMQAGMYTRQWNAANLSSGVYFYRLEAWGHQNEHFVDMKKLILCK